MMKRCSKFLCTLFAVLMVIVLSSPVFAAVTKEYSLPYFKNIQGADFVRQLKLKNTEDDIEVRVLEVYDVLELSLEDDDWDSVTKPFRKAFQAAGLEESKSYDDNGEKVYMYYSSEDDISFRILGKTDSHDIINEGGILGIECVVFSSSKEEKIEESFAPKGSVIMYSLDGKTIEVDSSQVASYQKYGWYTEPPAKMYAADGRTLYVDPTEVSAYQKVGWYTEPPIIMYAGDGRTLYVEPSEVQAYQNVGWYLEPVATMYADDGRTLVVKKTEIDAYQNVGWYTEPRIMMYAADGRTLSISSSECEAYKAVGWYTTPPVTMHAADGRMLLVSGDEIEAYKKVGWYSAPPVKMYAADGRTLLISGDEVDAYKNVGWYATQNEAQKAAGYTGSKNKDYTEARDALNDCKRYVSYLYYEGATLDKKIDLYRISGKASHYVDIVKSLNTIFDYYSRIESRCKDVRELYPLYLSVKRDKPYISTSSLARARTEATNAMRVKIDYNSCCEYYGGEKIE